MRVLGPTAFLGLALLLVAPTAWGGEGDGRGPRRPRRLPPPVRQEILEKFDANQDGKLDETEREAAREGIQEILEAHRQKILAEFDADGDGKLSREEMATVRKTHRERARQRILEKFDANGNGQLDEEEKAAIRQDANKRCFERFDKDGDGKLDETEFEKARRAMRGFQRRGMRQHRHHRGGGRGPVTPSD